MANYTAGSMPRISCLTSPILSVLSKKGSFSQVWKPRPRDTAYWTKVTWQVEGPACMGIPDSAAPRRELPPHSSLLRPRESQGNETRQAAPAASHGHSPLIWRKQFKNHNEQRRNKIRHSPQPIFIAQSPVSSESKYSIQGARGPGVGHLGPLRVGFKPRPQYLRLPELPVS